MQNFAHKDSKNLFQMVTKNVPDVSGRGSGSLARKSAACPKCRPHLNLNQGPEKVGFRLGPNQAHARWTLDSNNGVLCLLPIQISFKLGSALDVCFRLIGTP